MFNFRTKKDEFKSYCCYLDKRIDCVIKIFNEQLEEDEKEIESLKKQVQEFKIFMDFSTRLKIENDKNHFYKETENKVDKYSNISLQLEVRNDIYKILTVLGYDAMSPDCVAIYTENEKHFIPFYPFNKEKNFGCYKTYLKNLEIPINYDFKELIKIIDEKLKEME